MSEEGETSRVKWLMGAALVGVVLSSLVCLSPIVNGPEPKPPPEQPSPKPPPPPKPELTREVLLETIRESTDLPDELRIEATCHQVVDDLAPYSPVTEEARDRSWKKYEGRWFRWTMRVHDIMEVEFNEYVVLADCSGGTAHTTGELTLKVHIDDLAKVLALVKEGDRYEFTGRFTGRFTERYDGLLVAEMVKVWDAPKNE